MPDPEINHPQRKPDRLVIALVALTCLLVAAAIVVRLIPREEPTVEKVPPSAQPAGQKSLAPAKLPETSKQGTPATGTVVRTYPVYTNVSPMLKDFADRKSNKRVTADFEARVERVQSEADLSAVVAILKDTTDSDTVRNEASKLLARSGYTNLIDDLIAVLMNPAEGPRFRSFCVQHLYQNHTAAGEQQKKRVETVLQERIGDPDVTVQREALLALVRLGHPEGKKTAEQWLSDTAAGDRRDLAIRCMATLNLREHAPEIRGYLRDTNDIIRIAAIVALSDWNDTESRAAFEEAARSPRERLQHAGQVAMAKLDRSTATNAPSAAVR